MAKNIRKILSVCMVLCVLIGVLPLQALAATDGTTTEVKDGVVITTTQSTDTAVAGDSTTVTVTIEKTSEGTEESTGKKVSGSETTVTTTVTDANGNVIDSSWSVDGYEKKEWTEEDTGDTAGQPEVSVTLKPGQTNVGTSSETTVEGDTTTTVTDRTVTAETSDIKVTTNETNSGLVSDAEAVLNGPAPVYDPDDDLHINPSNGQPLDKVNGEHVGKDDVFDRNYLSIDSKYKDPSKWTDMPDEAEFRYVGTGEHSKYYNARVTVVFKKDAAGNPIFDEAGNPVIEKITKADGTIVTIDGVPATELPDGVSLKPIFDDYNGGRPTTFMLMDKSGNKVYAYCCDMDTGANKGTYYKVTNLEDCDYYASEESEEHIRTIAMNGYWGTTDIPNEDGSYAMGSLEGIKAKLRAAINDGTMENEVINMTVVDSEGNETVVTKTMMELLDELTEGEALLATQSAIWSYSNGSLAVQNGKDGIVVVDPDGYKWNHDPKVNSKDGEALDDFGSARVDFLYKWLINLEDDQSSTIIINDKNFVDDMSLTVGDKVADHANNQDDNKDNDVYNTALNFKLAFIPGANDDLLVQISYIDIDGNPVNVIRRLAGENGEGQSYETIAPEADGTYVLKGLQLSENEDWGFDIRLEGVQYLEHGVYVYEAVGGRKDSQTFVGVAEGTRSVDVSMGVTIKFDVDENNHVVAERKWHDEEHTPNVPEEEERTPPTNYRVTIEGDGTEEIIDDPVPLAAAPKTGDNSALWVLLIMAAGFGIAVLNIFGKKRNTTSV